MAAILDMDCWNSFPPAAESDVAVFPPTALPDAAAPPNEGPLLITLPVAIPGK